MERFDVSLKFGFKLDTLYNIINIDASLKKASNLKYWEQ